jgi:anti-sigma B factor antagonist
LRDPVLLEITEHAIGDVTVLTLKGRLVLTEAEESFREHVEALIARGRLKLVMDMTRVSYIDSAGLGMLVAKYVSAQRRGGDIRLSNLTARSEHVIDITRLSRVFKVFDSVDEAVHSFGSDRERAKPAAR